MKIFKILTLAGQRALWSIGMLLLASSSAWAQHAFQEITYDIRPGLQIKVFLPSTSPWGNSKPGILFVPGSDGGTADAELVRPFCEYYAQQGIVTVSTTRRALPPYPRPADFNPSDPHFGVWPAPLDDVRSAVWLMRQFSGFLGLNSNRIAAVGLSSGGTLVGHLGTTDVRDPSNTYSSKVQRVVSIGGAWDLKDILDKFRLSNGAPNNTYPDLNTLGGVMRLFGGTLETLAAGTLPSTAQAWDASPVSKITSSVSPTLFLHGTLDTLVPPVQATSSCQFMNAVAPGKCTIQLFNVGHTVPIEYLQPMNTFFINWLGSPE